MLPTKVSAAHGNRIDEAVDATRSSMNTLTFLLLFPLVPALLLAVIAHQTIRAYIVRVGVVVIGAASVYLAWQFLGAGTIYFPVESKLVDKALFGAEVVLSLYLLFRCIGINRKEWWIPLVILVQAGIMVYCELAGELPAVQQGALYVDNFSIIMVLIIGIIGSLICVYAISYMKEYHEHHRGVKDRRRFFFFILFFFLSAMFGVVLCNNLTWLFLCWEATTLCSFELIGYGRDEEATRNAYRALGLNALGGLAFVLGIFYLTKMCSQPTIELSRMLDLGAAVALIPAILFAFAGLTKSAQMPFSSWLLGAMVAPTPVSALLHSSTMVKAGVFIVVKLAPLFLGTVAGYMLACVGGITFVMTSILAVTQSNAKRVLAYSTIANLGLIIMCAGVGTSGAIWAAIMLIIFHAVAKALLFLGVGTLEHKNGSRDIEDMEGLVATRPWLGNVMIIGILGMFLAPFGMLISKWACIEALIVPGGFPPVLVVLLAFGSAPTLFFWAKWMGKLVSMPLNPRTLQGVIAGDEKVVLWLLAAGTLCASGFFPFIATGAVDTYISGIYGNSLNLGASDVMIMFIMLGFMVVLPLGYALSPKRSTPVKPYLGGANLEGNSSFQGSIGIRREVTTRNYYLADFWNEKKLFRASVIVTILVIIAMFLTVKVI
jgi:ech hydrogenase subunit A